VGGPTWEHPIVRMPDVEYARSAGVAIAYQVIGDAPRDVVWVRGDINDMLSSWERPEFVEQMVTLTLSHECCSSTSAVAGCPITFET
jgi:hypothetical protein